MKMLNNTTYDILKWIAIIVMPSLATFISVISKIWGWGEMGSMVAQTITAVGVLLGAVLGVSSMQYKEKEGAE